MALNSEGSFTYTPDANYDGLDTFTYRANDGENNSGVATVHITINPISSGNHVPVIVSMLFPHGPRAYRPAGKVNATLTDADSRDVHQAKWEWGDGKVTQGVVTEDSEVQAIVTDTYTYTSAGIYTVRLIVDDGHGGIATASSEQFIVVYDPDGGFVTGGGWIDSPAGAYARRSRVDW